MSSEIKADKWSPASGTSATIGDSGDTYTIPTGVTLNTSSATLTLPSTVITGQTAKTSLVDADKFLISDSAASGALKYVEKQYLPSGTLIKTASVDFESGTGANFVELQNCFSDTYDTYMFVIRRYLPEDNGDVLNFRLLTGTNTEVNASNYYYAVRYYEDTGSVGGPIGAAQNKFQISGGVHNGQEQGGLSGVIWITTDKTDDSGNAFKFTGTNGALNANSDHVSQFGSGTFLDTSADVDVTGVKMFCDNQIRKIHMICYGVKE